MHLISIKLPLIKQNDLLLDILVKNLKKDNESINEGDVLVISEKVVATSQGRIMTLSKVNKISEKAKILSKKYDMDERFVELILQESKMILGGMEHVILTKVDDFLIANSGIDQSNAGEGNVVLLPKNLKETTWNLYEEIKKLFKINNFGIIIADSRVQPLRKGTIGIAISSAGFEPIEDMRGKPDLFGRPLQITLRAVADDLASAAQFMLNEGNQQTPVVIIRGANLKFTENPKSSPKLEPEKCLYMNIFSKYLLKKKKE
ncbi:MAG: coenzyme F420-0:L-glutamate ligase [Candidatus Lokiarchaeota archaeon]|nr:coenzyme F420-0:L-glutamate ligase [Candidatus Lokiarchaeota archaeon]